MAKFTKNPRLQETVAGMVRSHIDKLAEDVRRRAEALSPPLQEWVVTQDARTHPEHSEMTGQKVPEGLRFEMRSDDWDRERRGMPSSTYLRWPRDRDTRAIVATRNCRCQLTPGGKFRILIEGPNISRGGVTATVYTNDEWATEAEFGTTYPDGSVAAPQRFMAKAAAQAAAAAR